MNYAQIGMGVILLSITGTVFQNMGFQKLKAALDGTAGLRHGFSETDVRSALAGT
jgi:hypothetical protein